MINNRSGFPAVGAEFFHDLRNCVTVISGFADLLRTTPDATLHQECCARITWACHLMLELAENGLDSERLRRGRWALELGDWEVAPLVKECLASVAPAAQRKQITVGADVPESRLLIHADRLAFCRILMNLLSNAIKFSSAKTCVEVRVKEQNGVLLEVLDHGPGIPEQDIPRLFQPFVTGTTAPTGGERRTGLGLAIVKRLAEAHGGEVRVQSRAGVGTTFIVHFPPRRGQTSSEQGARGPSSRSAPGVARWFTLGQACRAARRSFVRPGRTLGTLGALTTLG
jgi:signal transduction histidine kinase